MNYRNTFYLTLFNLLVYFLAVGCNENVNEDDAKRESSDYDSIGTSAFVDSSNIKLKGMIDTSKPTDSLVPYRTFKDSELGPFMQGIWFADTTENASFYIHGDSITYVDHWEEGNIVLFSNDTITIILEGVGYPMKVEAFDSFTIRWGRWGEYREFMFRYKE